MLANPHFLLLDFDFEAEEMVFVRASPEDLRRRLRLSALDFSMERLVLVPTSSVRQAVSSLAGPASIHFLFHLPFTGSTFLTRYLESEAVHLLRDPACLDAIFRSSERARAGQYPLDDLRHMTLALLNRPVRDSTTIVRTAGYYPEMIGQLSSSPFCRTVLFLYCEPEVFLLQVLKSTVRRRDFRLLMAAQRRFVMEVSGRPPELLADAELAAIFWVQAVSITLASCIGRLRCVDSADLFARPSEVVAAVATEFSINPKRLRTDNCSVRTTHAKDGTAFDPEKRSTQLQDLLTVHEGDLRAASPLLAELRAHDLLHRLRQKAIT